MELQGHLAHLPPLLVRDRSGADLLRAVLLVLAYIVEVFALGDDLHGGQIGVAQHGDLNFTALDLLLHHHMSTIGQQVIEGLLQLLAGVRQSHADGAAAIDHLHRAGYHQLLGQAGNILFFIMYVHPRGGADAQRVHHPLGHGLIHGHGAAQIAGAGVGYAQQIERGLNAAVLAVGAVHGQKYRIRHGTDLQHVLAQQGGAFVLPRRPDSLQIRGRLLDSHLFQQPVRRVKNILQLALIILQPHEHIHKNGLMTLFPQGAAHAAAADQSHMALGAEAAG